MKYLFYTLVIALALFSCQPNQSSTSNQKNGDIDSLRMLLKPHILDLDSIKKIGKLKVLTTYSGTSYFLYKGRPMGFEYELISKFAKDMNLEVELIIATNIDSLFIHLNRGDADVIAHGLTETRMRKKLVLFTTPLFRSHQVLVQKMPDKWYNLHWKEVERALIHDPLELIGDTVSVRANTSYHQRLINLADEMGGDIFINELSGDLTTEEIIEMVANGNIRYTVADNNIASLLASYYPILNIDLPISTSQNMAWATRTTSPQLNKALSDWLTNYKKHTDYHVIYNKYYKNKKDFRKRVNSEFYSLKQNQISMYDELIKEEAAKIGWDWRLLSSQVYQESRFKPRAISWAGAVGLMQMMPATAKEFGVTNRHSPEQSLAGGVRYLRYLLKRFDNITDSVQKIKLVLASYNCGFGHVLDAQSLARKHSLDPNVWDNNIEKMVLALRYPKIYNDPVVKYGYMSGIEPYTYVQQIFERYNHYKKFIKE